MYINQLFKYDITRYWPRGSKYCHSRPLYVPSQGTICISKLVQKYKNHRFLFILRIQSGSFVTGMFCMKIKPLSRSKEHFETRIYRSDGRILILECYIQAFVGFLHNIYVVQAALTRSNSFQQVSNTTIHHNCYFDSSLAPYGSRIIRKGQICIIVIDNLQMFIFAN